MGSLPNLHELSRESDSEEDSVFRHTAPITGPQRVIQRNEKCIFKYQPSVSLPLSANIGQKRHRNACRTRSNGNHNHLCDDLLMEQMTTYSPISSRSARILSQNQTQIINVLGRRRESLSSSIGATSVRRLIGIVRNTNSRLGPVYTRQILVKNLITLCVSHALISASFLPLVALQSSISAWHWPMKNSFITNLNFGSILMCVLYLFASCSSLIAPILIQKFGTKTIFIIGYINFALFFGAHFFPVIYVLVPAYVLIGFTLGPMSLGRITFVMTLASKMSYMASDDEDIEDHKHSLRRTCLIRRLARALQGAQDIGLIFGSICTAVLISYTINSDGIVKTGNQIGFLNNNNMTSLSTESLAASVNLNNSIESQSGNSITSSAVTILSTPCVNETLVADNNCSIEKKEWAPPLSSNPGALEQTFYYYASYDDLFDVDDNGNRICGSPACPVTLYFNFNISDKGLTDNYIYILPWRTSASLTSVYISCALIALSLACVGLDRIRLYIHQDPMERSMGLSTLRAVKESFKDKRLQYSAPLSFFIGLEQGFMYADFSKYYVVCSLGIHNINLVFLSMGLLQSLAAFTLSMLLRSIRRCIVIAVGFAFHALLIMVLVLWKPSGDDPALFYVISAAWGVCNSIWEMLNFTLITAHFPDQWEPAFANSMSIRFVGLALAFGVHSIFCNWIKLDLLGLFLLAAIIPYVILEMKMENSRKLKGISRL